MFELPFSVSLTRGDTGRPEAAKIVELDRTLAKTQIDGRWWKIESGRTARSEEQDHHWQWVKVLGEQRTNLAYQAIAVQTPDQEVQGAATYFVDSKSRLEEGEGTINLDRIATAPRNRPWLCEPPRFKGVGYCLLLAVVRHSYLLGLGGRVWLTSVPDQKTHDFYLARGFEVIFEDEDGILDFEISASGACAWLAEEGYPI
ncbi:hypothetical protein LF1_07070 [Rubripirellula obstinata]|uniref:N-acetyltransferase domain-containing protein n=1 Tax=Rubripirellula obstinata TaxID=406547 RepID=A0A5B1CD80_9BACT|nr:hypothetical protein [Rubripirellula obstinata]KAA1258191.1 hypothetical protein LF1_07070 [Rubripirellula obstinata]